MKTLTLLSIVLLISTSSLLAQISVSGKVMNEQHQPLAGVIVEQKGHATGVRTNFDGKFVLDIDSTTNILVFTYPGKEQTEFEINKTQIIEVILKDKIEQQEIVIEDCLMGAVAGVTVKSKVYKSARVKTSARNAIVYYPNAEYNTENYSTIHENGYQNPRVSPLSTFSADVDRASYANIRRFINMGQLPSKDAVRIEEMLNYFQYNLPQPEGDSPINISTELAECPWNTNHQIAMIALQAKSINTDDLPESNLVFLIDVSGSMSAQNKLPLVKSSLKMLVNQMREQDRIAIVTYAGSAGVALKSTSGKNKFEINQAIDALQAGGSTAGGKGLEMAYQIASQNFIKNGNNRIMLATDGDFNVGQSSDAEMERLVEKQRDNNIFLTVLGFGMGNYKDSKLETIADKGNGNYAYIDNSLEANKVLIQEFGGTLYTVAKDVKIQVEFNPEHVKSYRLIGYENRALDAEDFNNDKKDAGEIGAGHQVIALYEIVPATSSEESPSVDPLKYQKTNTTKRTKMSNELLTVKLRYKQPQGISSILLTHTLTNIPSTNYELSNNIKLAMSVAQFGMILRESEYKGNSTINNTIKLAKDAKGSDDNGYIGEFIRLAETVASLEPTVDSRSE